MNKERVIIDARKDENWLEKAVRLYEEGQLHKVIGSPMQIEDFLQSVEERRPKVPPEMTFSLELAPKELAEN